MFTQPKLQREVHGQRHHVSEINQATWQTISLLSNKWMGSQRSKFPIQPYTTLYHKLLIHRVELSMYESICEHGM